MFQREKFYFLKGSSFFAQVDRGKSRAPPIKMTVNIEQAQDLLLCSRCIVLQKFTQCKIYTMDSDISMENSTVPRIKSASAQKWSWFLVLLQKISIIKIGLVYVIMIVITSWRHHTHQPVSFSSLLSSWNNSAVFKRLL